MISMNNPKYVISDSPFERLHRFADGSWAYYFDRQSHEELYKHMNDNNQENIMVNNEVKHDDQIQNISGAGINNEYLSIQQQDYYSEISSDNEQLWEESSINTSDQYQQMMNQN